MSINAGYEDSKKMGLIHHIGMVERSAGYAAGNKMASMENFNKAFCINHAPGLEGLDNRCKGFEEAMADLGIQYIAEIAVPEDKWLVLSVLLSQQYRKMVTGMELVCF